MPEECFNCAAPTTKRYALAFSSGELYTDTPLCGSCAGSLEGIDRLEVVEGPVRTRGGDSDTKECPECGQSIPIRHWPRHVGTCTGDSTAHTTTQEK